MTIACSSAAEEKPKEIILMEYGKVCLGREIDSSRLYLYDFNENGLAGDNLVDITTENGMVVRYSEDGKKYLKMFPHSPKIGMYSEPERKSNSEYYLKKKLERARDL